MRILLVSEDIPSPTLGGLGKHVITLGNALIEAGHTVDLMGNTFHPHENQPGDVAFRGRFLAALDTRGANWKEHRLGFFIYWRHVYLTRRFARAILAVADQYDVIHYHGHLPILANLIPSHLNFVQTRHDQGSDCLTFTRFRNGSVCRETDPRACAGCAAAQPSAVQRALSALSVRLWRKAVARAFRRHKVIFVSKFLRDNAIRTLGPLDSRTVYVVPHFLDVSAISNVLSVAQPSTSAPDILIVGRIDTTKGVGAFLDAYSASLPAGRHVTVAGDGPELARLQGQYPHAWLRFLGWTPYQEVIQLTARARQVIVTSLCEEAFGGTTVEALSLGRPVLALNRGATPELKAYETHPGQLSLFEDMASLVAALGSLPAASEPASVPMLSQAADVRKAVPLIEQVYQA
ncbi:MAG: glycosyltransferase family 4 protein [Hydrogenophilales bacterium]|nr:glycosyltransferase family 4 protein [Hydrogenophilales bacterium]